MKKEILIILIFLILEIIIIQPVGAQEFIRGDSNSDSKVDISDAINTLGFLFSGTGEVNCEDSADANDDGILDISDAIYILNYLFIGGSAPPAPYPNQGIDSTNDLLVCQNFCENECLEGELRRCGNVASRTCGNFDVDECSEWGECVSRVSTNPRILWREMRMGGRDVAGAFVHQEGDSFSIGEFLEMRTVVIDFSIAGIKEAKADILLNGKVIETINLLCSLENEEILDTYLCGGMWNTQDVEPGQNTYTINLFVRDNLDREGSASVEYQLRFLRPDTSLCKELIVGHNSLNEPRINFVFVGYGYTGHDTPPEKILRSIAEYILFDEEDRGLFTIEPFNSNQNKFNIWYINEVGSLESIINCNPNLLRCHDPEFLGGSCMVANKYLINLIDGPVISGPTQISAGFYESSETGACDRLLIKPGGCVRSWLPDLVNHEVGGHNFGRLHDEYASRNVIADFEISGRNCYAGPLHTTEECLASAPWKDFIGDGCGQARIVDCQPEDENYIYEIGCFEGCLGIGGPRLGIFRPTRNSMMGSDKRSFGPWNERLICSEIRSITGSVGGICKDYQL